MGLASFTIARPITIPTSNVSSLRTLLGLVEDLNLFAYVGNAPSVFVDPLGLKPSPLFGRPLEEAPVPTETPMHHPGTVLATAPVGPALVMTGLVTGQNRQAIEIIDVVMSGSGTSDTEALGTAIARTTTFTRNSNNLVIRLWIQRVQGQQNFSFGGDVFMRFAPY